MQHLPNDIIGHISSFLTGPQLDQLGLVDKHFRLALQTESVVLPNKQKMFYNRWKMIKKLDSLPIPISDKLKRKISLQQNWKNPDFVPVVRKLTLVGTEPVIDHLLQHNLLAVVRQGAKTEHLDVDDDNYHDGIYYEIYDTVTLKFVQRLKPNFIQYHLADLTNDRYVVLCSYSYGPLLNRVDVIVWDFRSNTTLEFEAISEFQFKHDLLFCISNRDGKFRIYRGEKIIFEKQAVAKAFDVDYDKRMIAIAEEKHLALITYSPDWSKEINKKILALQRVNEPKLKDLRARVTRIRLKENYYVVSFSNAAKTDVTRVFDINTLEELYEADGHANFSQEDNYVIITDNDYTPRKIFDVRTGKDFNTQGNFTLYHMHGSLYHKVYALEMVEKPKNNGEKMDEDNEEKNNDKVNLKLDEDNEEKNIEKDESSDSDEDSQLSFDLVQKEEDKMVILPQFEELPHLSTRNLCQMIKSSGFDFVREYTSQVSGNEAQLVVEFGNEAEIFVLDFCDSIISE